LTEQKPVGFVICPYCGKTIDIYEGQSSTFHTCWGLQEMTEKEKEQAFSDEFKERME
jgi:hypothetical protein